MGMLLLTSAGFFNPNILDFFKKETKRLSLRNVAIITTAAEGKENNKYSQLAHQQLSSLGFKLVDFFDLEIQDSSVLSNYDTFYVCGGNTFKLLKFVKTSHFKDAVTALLNRNGMYIGVSAGSLIIGPSIEIANEVEPDPNEVGLADFTSLDIANVTISPHYESHQESEIKKFESRHNTIVTRLTNDQALLIVDDKSKILE